MESHFKLRDLGETEYLLGIGVTGDRSKRTLALSQKQYVLDMLSRFGMADCSPVSTPMEPGLSLSKEQSPKTPEERNRMSKVPYLSAVGALMYLATCTRPDIAYAVGVLARFNSDPGEAHWKAVKHLLRYLHKTLDCELVYGRKPAQTSPPPN